MAANGEFEEEFNDLADPQGMILKCVKTGTKYQTT